VSTGFTKLTYISVADIMSITGISPDPGLVSDSVLWTADTIG